MQENFLGDRMIEKLINPTYCAPENYRGDFRNLTCSVDIVGISVLSGGPKSVGFPKDTFVSFTY